MKTLAYVTNHDKKFEEAKRLIPDLTQLRLPYEEKWTYDIEQVVAHKLHIARESLTEPFIVEDTALYISALNDFPGALIHWIDDTVGYDKLFQLVQKTGIYDAHAVTMVGYWDGAREHTFSGVIHGQISHPQGYKGFGWDSYFKPHGLDETYAEMGEELKPEFSMRTLAFIKLKGYLEKN